MQETPIFDGKTHGFPVDFPNKTNPLNLARCAGGQLIYTSPLKALSAQKRREFAAIFGLEAVGLVPWVEFTEHFPVGSLGKSGESLMNILIY